MDIVKPFLKNKADISRTDIDDHPMCSNAQSNLKLSGLAIAPFGMVYHGSAVVHYYKKSGTNDFAFATQLVGLQTIEEGQADVGWKELKKALMKAYGREDKGRRTDTNQELI